MHKTIGYLAVVLCVFVISSCNNNDPSGPSFSTFEEELDYLVGRYVKMGAAVGIIDKQQQRHEFYYGSLSNSNSAPPGSHSVFDIGSITKTFTGTLLARMILDGKINLDDVVQSLLPEGEVTIPSWNGTEITMQHLATHSSGLPKKPQDSDYPLPPGYDPYDPYAAYSYEHVYEYLTSYCDLVFEPGTGYLYSNTGGGLIGHVLGLVDGSSYEEVVSREILEPLNMIETSLFLTAEQVDNLAPGHDDNLNIAKNYNANDIFQGAGFMKSSLHDMLIFLEAQMGLIGTTLNDAMDLSHQSHFDVGRVTYDDREGDYNLSIGLAWHIDVLPEGYTFHWHGGRTKGYMTYIAFDQSASTGVVILCNQSYYGVITRFGEDVLKAVNKY